MMEPEIDRQAGCPTAERRVLARTKFPHGGRTGHPVTTHNIAGNLYQHSAHVSPGVRLA